MNIYDLYHKIYSALELQIEKECCRYKTPLYTFISVGIPITLIIDDTNIFENEYWIVNTSSDNFLRVFFSNSLGVK